MRFTKIHLENSYILLINHAFASLASSMQKDKNRINFHLKKQVEKLVGTHIHSRNLLA